MVRNRESDYILVLGMTFYKSKQTLLGSTNKKNAAQVTIFFLTAVLAAAGPLGYDTWIPVTASLLRNLSYYDNDTYTEML